MVSVPRAQQLHIDSWMAVGDSPVIVFVTTRGATDYLDAHDNVISRSTTSNVTRDYAAWVAASAG